jgi:DNA polymerase-3 subunit beta
MKFAISKSKLSQNLQQVLQVVPNKSTLPILTNILIEALENKLKLSATDLDISITASVDCNVSKKGSAAVPAKVLYEIVRELPEAEIGFELVGNRIEFKIPNRSYKLSTVSPEEFPKIPAVNTKKEIRISGVDLVKMIRKTTFACSADDTRPALNGVLWQTKGDKMQMVATDGHRLAKMSVANTKLKGMHEDVIVPPKVLNLIPKFLTNEENEVGIIFGDNSIIFNLNEVVLTSRLIEGPYPNTDQVIPAKADKKLRIEKEELAGAVRRVSILSNQLTHQVKFSVKSGNLTLSTANADVGGEGKEVLDCDYNGDTIEMGYNAAYVTDILSRMDDNEVIFELTSPISAGVVYSPSSPKEEYLCLIMPLRLAE